MFLLILFLLLRPPTDHPEACILPFSDVVLQPDDITCGPACVTMLLRHYGIDADVDDVKEWTRTVWLKKDEGDIGMTLPSYIVDALEHYGLDGRLSYGDIDSLKRKVAMSKPCVVLVRSDEYSWHYVLVVGYDEKMIFFANPSVGEVRGLSTKEFEAAWSWKGDLEGRECGSLMSFLVRGVEVYPNSFVWVND